MENPYQPPRTDTSRPSGPSDPSGDDAVATIIPFKNPSALIAYYLGLFSCIPVVGLILAIIALVLGVQGLIYVRKHPKAHGTAHAWVGLVCGTIGLLINSLIVFSIVVYLVTGASRR